MQCPAGQESEISCCPNLTSAKMSQVLHEMVMISGMMMKA